MPGLEASRTAQGTPEGCRRLSPVHRAAQPSRACRGPLRATVGCARVQGRVLSEVCRCRGVRGVRPVGVPPDTGRPPQPPGRAVFRVVGHRSASRTAGRYGGAVPLKSARARRPRRPVGAGASRGPEPAEDACGRGVLRHVSVRRRCGRAEPRPCRPGGFTRERESSSVRVAASEFRADPASSGRPTSASGPRAPPLAGNVPRLPRRSRSARRRSLNATGSRIC